MDCRIEWVFSNFFSMSNNTRLPAGINCSTTVEAQVSLAILKETSAFKVNLIGKPVSLQIIYILSPLFKYVWVFDVDIILRAVIVRLVVSWVVTAIDWPLK